MRTRESDAVANTTISSSHNGLLYSEGITGIVHYTNSQTYVIAIFCIKDLFVMANTDFKFLLLLLSDITSDYPRKLPWRTPIKLHAA